MEDPGMVGEVRDLVRKELLVRIKRDLSGRHGVTTVPHLYIFLVRLLHDPAGVSPDPLMNVWLSDSWFRQALFLLVDLGFLLPSPGGGYDLTAKGRKMVLALKSRLAL